jgi:putative PIN family toxin of toxin-antitoxin system
VRVVLDTNVLVSALLTGGGAPDMAVQLVLQGAATLLVDSRILAEYDDVTARPRFGFDERERRAMLDVLALTAEHVVARPSRLLLPDPDDRVFVEVALAGRADVIVTGNVKHFIPRRGELGVAVQTPRAFVDSLRR